MHETAIAVAIFATLLMHYVFSFQRFTLRIARRHANDVSEVAHLQMLMTPTLMGAAGWSCSILLIVGAVLLSFAFFWWVGVIYVIFELFICSGIIPVFHLKAHFAGMARCELQSLIGGPAEPVAAILIIDVNRAEAGDID